VGLVVAGLLIGGCAGPKPSPQPSPGARDARAGVELTWWVVDELPASTPEAVAAGPAPGFSQVMAAYERRSVPVPWPTLEAWRGCGMRVISVPVGELDGLRRRLNIIGPTQQQWLGEVPRWTEAARSGALRGRATVQMDNGLLTLEPGTVRLLLRAWSAPGDTTPDASGTAGALQLEMVPQLVPPAGPGRLSLTPNGSTAAREGDGVVFSRLTLEASLTGAEALLIIPERPDAAWSGEPARDDPAPPPDGRSGKGPAPLGPAEPPAPTLGELLFENLSIAQGRRPRMILVITPNVRGEYRLTLAAAAR
jgi:hypothetical protein